MHRVHIAIVGVAAAALWQHDAQAKTYQVGPSRTYASLNDVQSLLAAGDVVEVDGDATYPGDIHMRNDATAGAPIILRGIPINGRMPVLSGGSEWTILLQGDHYVFDGFEVTGGPEYCVVHKAHDITIRNTIVHDCPKHGILGTDAESGSLTIENCEVFRCGMGEGKHQLYIATDETMHPGSVFRLQFTYVHDATGGHNVKSRAERNEIYFNWIEGAEYHGLDLIGPDGQDPDLAREDSDVVGNVVITTTRWQVARIGGDATGMTAGRYRFANNTFVLGQEGYVAIRLQESVESVELYNNVFFGTGEEPVEVIRHSEPIGPSPVIRGSNNWVRDDWIEIPDGCSGTIMGSDPGFADLAGFDFRPVAGSALIGAGTAASTASDGQAFPNPLMEPTFVPPYRSWVPSGSEIVRPQTGTVDIGSYEEGTPDVSSGGSGGSAGAGGSTDAGGSAGSGGSSGSGGPSTGGSSAGGVGPGGQAPASASAYWDDDADNCACRTTGKRRGASLTLLGLAAGLLTLRRKVARP